ncbi:hypothetical protein BABINDRAFT_180789 [Babjeviella inositovora NRRL Y-12698]|uniref:Stretch-activated cation channel Mid1 n=1 Tax=Babjeviella inositovora NRRL Y-12698 TaxID=984486 RepID=A0A1E3QN88_9ASCO|nr:uncharacterized protein BABINDRAFT_180789 [Babjeviella inositovora NRRL Y-12698]ODQ79100.1 hypothetical protein BABINDRAFT_180789 [Babjeviella inositovora NRRL Y-12698]
MFICIYRYTYCQHFYRKSGEPGSILEWTPVSAQIGQNETQYYKFAVDTQSYGASSQFEILIFLAGVICYEPSNVGDYDLHNSLELFYSFNASDMANLTQASRLTFSQGYSQGLAETLIDDAHSELYIAVTSPVSAEIKDNWSYQIAISQNDLVFQWDDRLYASLVDADFESALFVTGNISASTTNATLIQVQSGGEFNLFIYDYSYINYFSHLNNSWCAVRNGPVLIDTVNMTSNYTNRGGGIQQQFYIDGLNASTNYVAYLTQDFEGSGDNGGSIFTKFEFQTQSLRACRLIYDLEFCNNVAYSVPISSQYDIDGSELNLKILYDSNPLALYQNFTFALQQTACDTEADALYSTVRTCDDCATAYKNWLCAVTIPRCSTYNYTGFQYRDVGESRNPFVNTVVQPKEPYYEVLPCINLCNNIVQDCPVNDFAFVCPKDNATIAQSYYWYDDTYNGTSCNFVGSLPNQDIANAQASFFPNYPQDQYGRS